MGLPAMSTQSLSTSDFLEAEAFQGKMSTPQHGLYLPRTLSSTYSTSQKRPISRPGHLPNCPCPECNPDQFVYVPVTYPLQYHPSIYSDTTSSSPPQTLPPPRHEPTSLEWPEMSGGPPSKVMLPAVDASGKEGQVVVWGPMRLPEGFKESCKSIKLPDLLHKKRDQQMVTIPTNTPESNLMGRFVEPSEAIKPDEGLRELKDASKVLNAIAPFENVGLDKDCDGGRKTKTESLVPPTGSQRIVTDKATLRTDSLDRKTGLTVSNNPMLSTGDPLKADPPACPSNTPTFSTGSFKKESSPLVEPKPTTGSNNILSEKNTTPNLRTTLGLNGMLKMLPKLGTNFDATTPAEDSLTPIEVSAANNNGDGGSKRGFVTPGTFGYRPYFPKKSYSKDRLYGPDEHLANNTNPDYLSHTSPSEKYHKFRIERPSTPPPNLPEDVDFTNAQECYYNPSNQPDFNYYCYNYSPITYCSQSQFETPLLQPVPGYKNSKPHTNRRVVRTPPGFSRARPRTQPGFIHTLPQSPHQFHRVHPPPGFHRTYFSITPPQSPRSWQRQSENSVSCKSVPKLDGRGVYNPHTDEWIHTHDWYPGCGFGYGDNRRDTNSSYSSRHVEDEGKYDLGRTLSPLEKLPELNRDVKEVKQSRRSDEVQGINQPILNDEWTASGFYGIGGNQKLLHGETWTRGCREPLSEMQYGRFGGGVCGQECQ